MTGYCWREIRVSRNFGTDSVVLPGLVAAPGEIARKGVA
jgi:hypothetical protein